MFWTAGPESRIIRLCEVTLSSIKAGWHPEPPRNSSRDLMQLQIMVISRFVSMVGESRHCWNATLTYAMVYPRLRNRISRFVDITLFNLQDQFKFTQVCQPFSSELHRHHRSFLEICTLYCQWLPVHQALNSISMTQDIESRRLNDGAESKSNRWVGGSYPDPEKCSDTWVYTNVQHSVAIWNFKSNIVFFNTKSVDEVWLSSLITYTLFRSVRLVHYTAALVAID